MCKENGTSGSEGGMRGKRALEDEDDGNSDILSKNKQKKKLRNPNKRFDPSLKRKRTCPNPDQHKEGGRLLALPF